MYLNNAYFGNGVWGARMLQEVFGVSAVQLSLDQSAGSRRVWGLRSPATLFSRECDQSPQYRSSKIWWRLVMTKQLIGLLLSISMAAGRCYEGKSEGYRYLSILVRSSMKRINEYG